MMFYLYDTVCQLRRETLKFNVMIVVYVQECQSLTSDLFASHIVFQLNLILLDTNTLISGISRLISFYYLLSMFQFQSIIIFYLWLFGAAHNWIP